MQEAEGQYPQPEELELRPEELAHDLTEQSGHRLPLSHGQRVQKDLRARPQGVVGQSGGDQQYLCTLHALSHRLFAHFEPLARGVHREPLQCLHRRVQPKQHDLEHHSVNTQLSSHLPSVNWLRIVPIPVTAQSHFRWHVHHWLHQIGEPIDRVGLAYSEGDPTVEE